MKTCNVCEKEFSLNGGRGGQNRKICYECLPSDLPRNERKKVVNKLYLNKARAEKIELGCSVCGYNRCGSALEWHHKDSDKLHDPSNVLQFNWDKYKQEILKCLLLCANCHRELHELGC